MAAIKNSIQLQDRMTPVFRSIIKSMDSTLKVMQRLDKTASKGVQSKAYQRARFDVDKASASLQKMENQIIQANNKAERLAGTMNKVSHSANSASSSMQSMGRGGGINLVNLSAAVYLLQNIKDLVTSLMEGPDIAMSTKARLGLFNESNYSKEQLYDQLYATSLETRTGLEETGNLVTRIMISGAMEGEGSSVGALKAAEIINKALIAGGGTSEENRRSLLQLSQGLASGMLQGDELRAIREQTPYLTDIIAQGLGKIDTKFAGATIGDLKQLGKEGELTADRILKAIFSMESEVSEAFKQMPRTFGQATTQMGSIWMYFLNSLNTADGAIGKINAKMWQFVDYLLSPAGADFMNDLATGINFVVDLILNGIDLIAWGINWLRSNLEIVQTVLMAVGTAAVIGGAKMFKAYLSAHAPLILVLAALSAMYYLALSSGETTGSMVGKIVTMFILMGNRVAAGAVLIFTAIEWIVQGLLVGMYTMGEVIWNILVGLVMGVFTVIGLIMAIAFAGVKNVSNYFANMAIGILDSLGLIAKAMDWIFGTNMAKTINGWKDGIRGIADSIETKLTVESIPILNDDTWKNAPWANMNGIEELKGGKWTKFEDLLRENNAWNTVTDADAYMIGADIAKGIDDGAQKYDVSKEYANFLKDFDPGAIEYAGGNLDKVDEVGKINSDVSLSDEDVQLLRDISAKQFLINLNTIAPVIQATFGDIKETVDVEEIMGAIEEMILNAAATSLID